MAGEPARGPHAPYRQMERLPLYAAAAQRLLADDLAYPCFCTPEELDADRKAQEAAKQPPRYVGRCAGLTAEERRRARPRAVAGALRFRVGDGRRRLRRHRPRPRRDRRRQPRRRLRHRPRRRHAALPLHGRRRRRGDGHHRRHPRRGPPLQHAQAHPAVPGARPRAVPRFAHLPLILNADRTKMSKRKSQTAIGDYIAQGFIREALVNYLALLGWSTGHRGGDPVARRDRRALRPRDGPQGRRRLRPRAARVAQRPVDPPARRRRPDRPAAAVPRGRARRRPDRPDAVRRRAAGRCCRSSRSACRRSARSATWSASCGSTRSRSTRRRSCPSAGTRPRPATGWPRRGRPSPRSARSPSRPTSWSRRSAPSPRPAAGRPATCSWPSASAVTGRTATPPLFDTLVALGRDRVLERLDRALARPRRGVNPVARRIGHDRRSSAWRRASLTPARPGPPAGRLVADRQRASRRGCSSRSCSARRCRTAAGPPAPASAALLLAVVGYYAMTTLRFGIGGGHRRARRSGGIGSLVGGSRVRRRRPGVARRAPIPGPRAAAIGLVAAVFIAEGVVPARHPARHRRSGPGSSSPVRSSRCLLGRTWPDRAWRLRRASCRRWPWAPSGTSSSSRSTTSTAGIGMTAAVRYTTSLDGHHRPRPARRLLGRLADATVAGDAPRDAPRQRGGRPGHRRGDRAGRRVRQRGRRRRAGRLPVPCLEVLPAWQRQGIGSELVRRVLLHELAPRYMVDLVCDEDVVPFYERLGFMPYRAMIRRDRAARYLTTPDRYRREAFERTDTREARSDDPRRRPALARRAMSRPGGPTTPQRSATSSPRTRSYRYHP